MKRMQINITCVINIKKFNKCKYTKRMDKSMYLHSFLQNVNKYLVSCMKYLTRKSKLYHHKVFSKQQRTYKLKIDPT